MPAFFNGKSYRKWHSFFLNKQDERGREGGRDRELERMSSPAEWIMLEVLFL